MFRALCLRLSHVRPAHVAIGVLACLLLVTLDGLVPQPAQAASGSGAMASTRRTQTRAARKMRRTDQKIKRLTRTIQKSRKRAASASRRLDRVRRQRDRVKARLAAAADRRDYVRTDRDRKLRVHPNPAGRQIADLPRLRKRARKLDAKVKVVARKVRRLRRKAARNFRVRQRKASAVARIARRIDNKKAKRERAEAVLGSSIKRMVELAQRRASTRTSARPASSGFRRPVRGRISQGYGCQSRKRGTCVRFHDGIDIATRRGARVRASATGYVAYVGWNPWDGRRRAYIVIIGHAGGYETIYAHLKPVRKVRAGQLVRQGQTIGLSGNTGRSTGPHVHWEVSRGFRTMDPRSV